MHLDFFTRPSRLGWLGRSSWLGLAGVLLVGGCSTIAPPAVSQLPRSYHEAISMAGRLSVQYQQNGQPQSMQGKFSWTQNGPDTSIALLSPLGQTMAKIDITPGRASLQQAGQPLRQATDISALTTQTLGWPLPVAGLRNWLQGFVADGEGHRVAALPASENSAGNVGSNGSTGSTGSVNNYSSFSSDGWQVRYVSWQGAADEPAYPKRIDLERVTPAGPIALRIVIDSWQPH